MAVVSRLAITPVKATRLHEVDHVAVDHDGVRENRRFYLIDARDRMVNAKHLGRLNAVVADYDDPARRLRLAFPDGSVVEDTVRLGDQIDTRFYSIAMPARVLEGPWSAALSGYVDQPLRVVEPDRAAGGVDRGSGGAVSLVSRASLARLAEAGGRQDVDGRRFRMLIEVDGIPAHGEDEWVGLQVGIGEATVEFRGHVGRCLITSRHPETGEIDLPTLDILRSYRGDCDSSEPLPFGVYGRVVVPGTIRVGDRVIADG